MVGIVIVSHSFRIAEGVAELAREMGGADVKLETAGGLEAVVDDESGAVEHPIGTDAVRVMDAIERALGAGTEVGRPVVDAGFDPGEGEDEHADARVGDDADDLTQEPDAEADPNDRADHAEEHSHSTSQNQISRAAP